MYERDNYMPVTKKAAGAEKRGMSAAVWLQWVVGTAVAAAVGQGVAQFVAGILLPDAAYGTFLGFIVGIVAGAIMGGIIGLAQGAVLAKAIGSDGWRDWTLAGMLSGSVRWGLIGPLSLLLLLNTGGAGYRNEQPSICGLFFAFIIFGVLSGLAFGIPQAFVLRRRLGEITGLDNPAWIIANAGAALFGIPIITLTNLNSGTVGAISGASMVDLANNPSQFTGPGAVFAILAGQTSNLHTITVIAVTVVWALVGFLTSFPLRDKLRGSAE